MGINSRCSGMEVNIFTHGPDTFWLFDFDVVVLVILAQVRVIWEENPHLTKCFLKISYLSQILLVMEVEGWNPLWVVPPLGRWSWAVLESRGARNRTKYASSIPLWSLLQVLSWVSIMTSLSDRLENASWNEHFSPQLVLVGVLLHQ